MFNHIGNKKNYEYIVEQIKDMIINGELTVGERLPTEKELSEKFGVSRTSVREALPITFHSCTHLIMEKSKI